MMIIVCCDERGVYIMHSMVDRGCCLICLHGLIYKILSELHCIIVCDSYFIPLNQSNAYKHSTYSNLGGVNIP